METFLTIGIMLVAPISLLVAAICEDYDVRQMRKNDKYKSSHI